MKKCPNCGACKECGAPPQPRPIAFQNPRFPPHWVWGGGNISSPNVPSVTWNTTGGNYQ